jgi:hypothetical protein
MLIATQESCTAIRDVSFSLKAIFKDKIPELQDDNAISFDSPGDMNSSSMLRLSLYLYSINENEYSRNRDREYEEVYEGEKRVPGQLTVTYPPISLDLNYIFTPFAKDRETELLILGKIIQTLYQFPGIENTYLKGNLAASGNKVIRITPNNLPMHEAKKLWEAFPGKSMKPCLSYLVTPVLMSFHKQNVQKPESVKVDSEVLNP